MASNLFLVLGGTRSGKSDFAEELAASKGEKILYIATAACLDEEMERRVKKHRANRPDKWDTIEEQLKVIDVIKHNAVNYDAILLDCLTLFISNMMYSRSIDDYGQLEQEILQKIAQLAEQAEECCCPVVIVSSEVGLGLVPDNSLGRLYRDILGKANQILAAKSKKAYLVVAGIPISLKDLQQKLKEGI